MSDTMPINSKFGNRSENRDHNIFLEEYYGGADCYIYIDNKLYENISAIQFTLREQKKPLYGYSSLTFDKVVDGSRIVQGIIKVPVKNTKVSEVKDSFPLIEYKHDKASSRSVAPEWLYNYRAKKETDIVKYEIQKKYNKIVTEVQQSLKRLGYDIEVTGLTDIKTKLAVMNYKSENNLPINSKIDLELENRLDIHKEENVKNTLRKTGLRFYPSEDSYYYRELNPGATIVIQGEHNDWYLVQEKNGSKGYIKKEDVL